MTEKDMYAGYLEGILFPSEEFELLKTAINQLAMNKIEPKQLRKIIIDSKMQVFDKLLEFIPFQIKHGVENSTLDQFMEKREAQNSSYLKEIQEKDDFITEIMQRLERINETLMERQIIFPKETLNNKKVTSESSSSEEHNMKPSELFK